MEEVQYDPKLLELVDHCEMDHEFEVAPGTTVAQVENMHNIRHENDLDHTQFRHYHTGDEVVYLLEW